MRTAASPVSGCFLGSSDSPSSTAEVAGCDGKSTGVAWSGILRLFHLSLPFVWLFPPQEPSCLARLSANTLCCNPSSELQGCHLC